jgi:hypothetical protein
MARFAWWQILVPSGFPVHHIVIPASFLSPTNAIFSEPATARDILIRGIIFRLTDVIAEHMMPSVWNVGKLKRFSPETTGRNATRRN